MTYRVTHRTTYEYDEPVSTSYHALRLTPPFPALPEVPLEPADHGSLARVFHDRSDYFGNAVVLFTLQESVDVIPVEES